MTPIYHMRTHTLISTPRTQIHTSEINNEAIGAVYVHIHPPEHTRAHSHTHILMVTHSHTLTYPLTNTHDRHLPSLNRPLPLRHANAVQEDRGRPLLSSRCVDDGNGMNFPDLPACLPARVMVYGSCDRRRRG